MSDAFDSPDIDAYPDRVPGRKFDLLRRKLVGAGLSEQSANIAIRVFDDHLDQDVELIAISRPVLYSFDWSDSSAAVHWAAIKQDVFERDNYKCFYCKADVIDAPTVDHIRPRSKQGPGDYSNLITACKSCNSSKCDRDVYDWMASRA